MKSTRLVLLVIAGLGLLTRLSAQTLTGYGVIKTHYLEQTSPSAPVEAANPYGLSAYVFGSGLAGTYRFTSPGGTATSPQNLVISGNQAAFDTEATTFLTTVALNLAYNEGVYSMDLPNTNGAAQSANLPSLTGDDYPGAPTIGGSWSGGKLQIDATQNHSLTFSAFSGFTVAGNIGDSISLNIDGVGTTYFANTAVTSFLITAGTLTPGVTYDASLRFNRNYIDYGTTIAGANGNGGFTADVTFQIQAVPEPATYAAFAGVLALAGAVRHRRRRAA